MTTTVPYFLRALADQRERESIDEGIVAAARQYYADYEGETSILHDHGFYTALKALAEYGMVGNVDELIREAEMSMTRESGRKFDAWDVEDLDAVWEG